MEPKYGHVPILSMGDSPLAESAVSRENARMGQELGVLAARIRERLEDLGLKPTPTSRAVTGKNDLIRDIERGRMPNAAYLAKLADYLQVSEAWLWGKEDGPPPPPKPLEQDREPDVVDIRPAVEGPLDLPVYAAAQAGPDGEILYSTDRIETRHRPEWLIGVEGAFAMYVVNDSMEPMMRQGDLLMIHPTRPPRSRDCVLVVMTDDGDEYRALVKEYVKRSGDKVVLRQYNPEREIRLPSAKIKNLQVVTGIYFGR